jgi:hypothetical protein
MAMSFPLSTITTGLASAAFIAVTAFGGVATTSSGAFAQPSIPPAGSVSSTIIGELELVPPWQRDWQRVIDVGCGSASLLEQTAFGAVTPHIPAVFAAPAFPSIGALAFDPILSDRIYTKMVFVGATQSVQSGLTFRWG